MINLNHDKTNKNKYDENKKERNNTGMDVVQKQQKTNCDIFDDLLELFIFCRGAELLRLKMFF